MTLAAEHKSIVMTQRVPDWIKYIVNAVLHGDSIEGVCEVSVTEDGDLLMYRKITSEDILAYPALWNVEDVWVTQKISEG